MKRTRIIPDLTAFPEIFHPLLAGAEVYDSSCSQTARVWYIDRQEGFYLKSAAAGSLAEEAALTAYFHRHHLSAEVLAYHTNERDWLLTRRIPGEDCLHQKYLDDPVRLCDTTATLLRQLHSLPGDEHLLSNRTGQALAKARDTYLAGTYDTSLFPDNWGYASPEEAWQVLQAGAQLLKSDTLLHGDYCLPNILLDDWRFSGFIDVGAGGMGDRHFDLFWGIWSLGFNLKTDRYRERFLDAYGREAVEPELLKIVAACEVFG